MDLARTYPMAEDSESARRAWEARHEKAVSAVRGIGAKALPHLLRWVRSARRPSPLREKLEELLDKQSLLRIELPQRPDHTEQLIQGFRALGSAANRPCRNCAGWFKTPATCAGAVIALGAIGPAAFPVLAPELTNSNCPMQSYLVDVLVELAPSVAAPTSCRFWWMELQTQIATFMGSV